jgi:hypothetical protein
MHRSKGANRANLGCSYLWWMTIRHRAHRRLSVRYSNWSNQAGSLRASTLRFREPCPVACP